MGNVPSIKKIEVDQLDSATHFEPKEIKALYKQFKKETPSGKITRMDFGQAMNMIGIAEPFLQELIFKAFDENDDGEIDFNEFTKALSIMTRGTNDEKLQFAFRMYDLDQTGYVTKEEMGKILGSFFNMVGPGEENQVTTFSSKKYESPPALVDELFEQMDTDEDGKISLEDYKEGARQNPDIIQGLRLFSSNRQY
eukprot:TRINITY_DN4203_c1_g1_i1.p1 TRINITY_DN4203_c1_g1~~TRINITY_DN4203_c1_g1_i1.p1  ORF type:complete len:196 (-),score=89.20 TRINITY_DN4203_c1_g1_i1:162-749(-)